MVARIYIVCSDEARNGKTLFARLYADQMFLADPERLCVFDTDHPRGDLAHRFPGRSHIIDLSRTADQVKLFDTMIREPNSNYVVDLKASLLTQFFRIFHDIAFDQGTNEVGIGVTVFFILDRTVDSISSARSVRQKIGTAQFVPVVNEAIGSPMLLPGGTEAYARLEKDSEVTLPILSSAAREYVEQPDFSFSGFIAGEADQAPPELRYELWRFLEIIYNQRGLRAQGNALTG